MIYDNFLRMITDRQSIRNYKERQVDIGTIQKIIEAGIQAPSPTNSQGWKFRLVDKSDDIREIADEVKKSLEKTANHYKDGVMRDSLLQYGKNFFFFKKAPLLIFCYVKRPGKLMQRFFTDQETLHRASGGLISMGMVLQNMMLAATTLELGSCILTGPLIAEKKLTHLIPPPDKHDLAAIMTLGYPATPGKNRNRKPVDKFILKND